MGDVLAIGAFFAGVIGFFAVVILGVMRIEGWRQRRAAEALARGLEGATLGPAGGPGAWELTGVEGRRAGCQVALSPRALGWTVPVSRPGGATRMRAMGVELLLRGSRAVGRGTMRARGGDLVLDGELAPVSPATRAALVACSADLALDGLEARATFALPLQRRTVAEMLALIDAVGPYLAAEAPTATAEEGLALHRAVERQDVEQVAALLVAGADPNALDERGRPPLAYALPWAVGFLLSEASERIIVALLAAGAEVSRGDVGRALVAEANAMVTSALEAGDARRLERLLGLA